MDSKAGFAFSPNASRAGVLKTRLIADQWACLIARIINDFRSFGITTAPPIAAELNRRGIPTLRNGRWHASTVNNLLHRYAHVRRTNPDLVAHTLLHPPPALLKLLPSIKWTAWSAGAPCATRHKTVYASSSAEPATAPAAISGTPRDRSIKLE